MDFSRFDKSKKHFIKYTNGIKKEISFDEYVHIIKKFGKEINVEPIRIIEVNHERI